MKIPESAFKSPKKDKKNDKDKKTDKKKDKKKKNKELPVLKMSHSASVHGGMFDEIPQ